MLFLPKSKLPPKKNGAGYARGHGASGHWLRTRASVINSNTDGMSRWRHLFNVAKMNYKATLPGGRNTAPVLGITPWDGWAMQSTTYFGVEQPGLIQGDIQLISKTVGCSSVEAYEVMISTTLAQMNQTTPIAPPITTVQAVASGGDGPVTDGTATFEVITKSYLGIGPISAAFRATLTISGFTMPTPPTPTAPVWVHDMTLPTQFAMLPNTAVAGGGINPGPIELDFQAANYVCTVTGLPADIVFILYGIPLPATIWITAQSVSGFIIAALPSAQPGTYQATMQGIGPSGTYTYNFVVTILDPSVYTLALSFTGLPANVTAAILGYAAFDVSQKSPVSLEGLPNGINSTFSLNYDPSASMFGASLIFLVTIDPSTPIGDYTFSATLTGWATALTVTPVISVTSIGQTPGQPCAPFQVANKLDAYTICDGNWNVTGFSLTPIYPSEFNDPSQPTNYSIAQCWTITASPAYTSGYAAPPASSYINILTTGPGLPNPQQLLTAWEDAFGPLPPSGKIKIMLQWVDALTGAPGPECGKTLSWENGTNRGVQMPMGGWPGPNLTIGPQNGAFIAPGTYSYTITGENSSNYTGTVTFTAFAASYIPTGIPPGADAMPVGLTITFEPPSITFLNGIPQTGPVTANWTLAAGAQAFSGSIGIRQTDGTITQEDYLTINITGDVTPPPPYNFLTMYPVKTEIYTPLNSSTALIYDLFNSGPADMPVYMLTTNTDADYTIEFGQGGPATATATPTSITFSLATSANTNELEGQLLSSSGYAPAGYNITDAPILSNTDTTVTVLCTNNPAAMANAGIAAVITYDITVPAGTLTSQGTTSVVAFVEVGSAYTGPTPQMQIVANSGKNNAYCILGTDSNPGNGFQMYPTATYIDQPVPGSTTVPITFSNTNPSPITANLTPYYGGNGVTVTFGSSSVTIPAAAEAVPGTATVNVTITATAEADLTQNPATVQAVADQYSQIVSIFFTDTEYGPLYLSLSPVNLAPTNGTSQSTTLTVNNTSAATATVALAPSYIPSGFTITVTPSSVTVGPGSTASPTTATATVTVTVASGSPITTSELYVNGAASGYNEMAVRICQSYTT
jgi:hypothetical protein